ncbi:hypothetical protein [Kineosporia babensis]|uniref:Uncharacterized protein n=1 Tax=Kineosporia babensis TaxID=499548 RepID=A0A9X1NLW7_9ACTN|nr:hypothetical protein [Kineosporia babensis]MCD5316725.1 hypothetical protein [Kineosporia babensis]
MATVMGRNHTLVAVLSLLYLIGFTLLVSTGRGLNMVSARQFTLALGLLVIGPLATAGVLVTGLGLLCVAAALFVPLLAAASYRPTTPNR